MFPLTDQVRSLSKGKPHLDLVEALMAELPSDSHVEHLLSQLGDYAALANRTRSGTVRIGGKDYGLGDLDQAHIGVVASIVETIRWGYVAATGTTPERIGTRDKCIVDVSGHRDFANALFGLRAGREDRRKPIHLFTTNYDTLIEDAPRVQRDPPTGTASPEERWHTAATASARIPTRRNAALTF